MRNIFKTTVAGIATVAMVATLLVGVNVAKPTGVNAATVNTLSGKWVHIHEPYEKNNNDADIANTKVTDTADQFKANISITGWQRMWTAEQAAPGDAIVVGDGWGDKPYQLTSTTTGSVVSGNTYNLNFTISNDMKDAKNNPTEKNVTITVNSGIEGDFDNTMLFETVRIPAGETKEFSYDITVDEFYTSNTVQVQFAYGSYAYSFEASRALTPEQLDSIAGKYCYAPGTTENVNATGLLTVSNVKMLGEKYEIPTDKPTDKPTVNPPTGGDQKPGDSTKPPAKVSKPARVKKVKAKNSAKKTVRVSWKKVSKATKYQVKVGKKKVTTKKISVKVKNKKFKKGKKYKVQVRAYNKAGYGKWSKAIRVKIKK